MNMFLTSSEVTRILLRSRSSTHLYRFLAPPVGTPCLLNVQPCKIRQVGPNVLSSPLVDGCVTLPFLVDPVERVNTVKKQLPEFPDQATLTCQTTSDIASPACRPARRPPQT